MSLVEPYIPFANGDALDATQINDAIQHTRDALGVFIAQVYRTSFIAANYAAEATRSGFEMRIDVDPGVAWMIEADTTAGQETGTFDVAYRARSLFARRTQIKPGTRGIAALVVSDSDDAFVSFRIIPTEEASQSVAPLVYFATSLDDIVQAQDVRYDPHIGVRISPGAVTVRSRAKRKAVVPESQFGLYVPPNASLILELFGMVTDSLMDEAKKREEPLSLRVQLVEDDTPVGAYPLVGGVHDPKEFYALTVYRPETPGFHLYELRADGRAADIDSLSGFIRVVDDNP